MGSRASDGEWTGGAAGADAEAATGPPETCAVPPRSGAGPPVNLLGRSDGTIDSFRRRESDACIENANVQGCQQNITYNKGRCLRDAVADGLHALESEMYHSANEEPTTPTAECSKEDTLSIQGYRKNKVKIISFVTPISKENHKRDNSSSPQLDEGAMKRQVLESNAVGLDARVEVGVINPTELESNVRVYDVETAAYGNYKGHGVPLSSLMSEVTRRPIKGYPVTVEALEDSCPATSTEVHCPAVTFFNCLMGNRVPRQTRSLRKPRGSRKIFEHDLVESSGPSIWSWRFSSCNLSRERSNRGAEVTEDFLPSIRSATKPASSPRQTRSFPSFAKMLQVRVAKGSPQTSHSPPVDAMGDSETDADDFQSGSRQGRIYVVAAGCGRTQLKENLRLMKSNFHPSSATGRSPAEDHVRQTNHFAGSHGSPSFPSPVSTSPSRSINGCTALYLCSASTLCAPVRLV